MSAVTALSSAGMEPVKRLDWIFSIVSAVRFPISDGKVPDIPWLVKLGRFRIVTLPPLTVTPGQVPMC